MQSLIVDRTHLVQVSGKLVLQKRSEGKGPVLWITLQPRETRDESVMTNDSGQVAESIFTVERFEPSWNGLKVEIIKKARYAVILYMGIILTKI